MTSAPCHRAGARRSRGRGRRLGPRAARRRARARRASTRCSTRPRAARRRVRRALRRQGRRARRPPASRRDAASSPRSQELVGRAGSYALAALLRRHRRPRARRAAAARAGAGRPRSRPTLLFFELEWAALDDERAEELLADRRARLRRHHLRTARRYRPHLLSEPEEQILTEKALTGRSAWARLFEEQTVGDRGRAAGRRREPVALEVALARLFDARPRRAPRRRRGGHRRRSQPGLRTRALRRSTRCSPTRRSTTGCARYPHWLASPQPRQRGVRRVGAGAGRGGARPLRARRAAGTG